jgi:HAD superfamily hydrolase (TIGR01484 family)
MRYLALACDYDGTLALAGHVDPTTVDALRRLRESGRRLVLVTGRSLADILAVFPAANLFDRIIAENGAVLYRPAEREEKDLADPPSPELVAALRHEGVMPLSVGRTIVATWHPNETTVLRLIRDLGLELQVIFNKGAVMVLPSGVNKASGLAAALGELALSAHNCVGVGDAENDHTFLALCECAVAVANALPMLQERADLVTRADHGAGVIELIERMLASDLEELQPTLSRHLIPLGKTETGETLQLDPYGSRVLIAGPSGSGKSTLATAILEQLAERGYQICVIDPEGDYSKVDWAIVLGDQTRATTIPEVLDVLSSPGRNVVVNLLGIALAERPQFFAALLPRLLELRAQTGRPHWIVIDEAHHLLPASPGSTPLSLPQDCQGVMLVTVHPEAVAPAVLSSVAIVTAVGGASEEVIRGFCEATGQPMPQVPAEAAQAGEAVFWAPSAKTPPVAFRSDGPRGERRRHLRKYAAGELGPDRSFYFRGPDERLNLRAQNLVTFLQLADGVDDETWLHHLHRGDYSRWFRESIKDDALTDEAEAVETAPGITATESRAGIRAAVERRYTLPS